MRIAAPDTLLTLISLLLLPAIAFGEISMGESIEWITQSRPHIAIVRIAATRGTGSKGAVATTLKGEPPAAPVFRDRHLSAGGEYLVFFDAKKNPDAVFDLEKPATNHRAPLAMDMSLLDTREKILAAVDARLKRGGPPGDAARNLFQSSKGFVYLEVPPSSGAWNALYGGSACYLAVPADPEVKEALVRTIDTSKSAWDRAHATRKLSAFPGDDTVARLRALLEDPAVEEMTRSDETSSTKFSVPVVRQAAWDALKELGVDAPKPAGYRDDYTIRAF